MKENVSCFEGGNVIQGMFGNIQNKKCLKLDIGQLQYVLM